MTTKNTLPAKKTAWGGRRRELQATNCSSSSKNMKNAPQSLFFNMLDFSLLRRLSVVFARALCTELELSPAGPSKVNPISTQLVSFVWPLLLFHPPFDKMWTRHPDRFRGRSRNTCTVQVTSLSSWVTGQAGEDVEVSGSVDPPAAAVADINI